MKRVSYPKDLRDKAKEDGLGLVTVEFITAKGGRVTMQTAADEHKIQTASDFIKTL